VAEPHGTIEVEVAVLTTHFANMAKLFEIHTEQDRVQFSKLDDKLSELSEKLDNVQLQLAHAAGEHEGKEMSLKRMAGFISFIVSTGVAIVTLLLKSYGS